MFNCITGFYRPTARRDRAAAIADGAPVRAADACRATASPPRAKVARTFQNIRLFAGMTVLENLLVAQHNTLMAATGFGVLAVFGLGALPRGRGGRRWSKARHLAGRDRPDSPGPTIPAGALPYGAQRRLEIARAMCIDPVLLCLDEPAAGLNPRETRRTRPRCCCASAAEGCSLLLIEHDMGVVMRISDHIVVLDHGKKISDGTPGRGARRPAR